METDGTGSMSEFHASCRIPFRESCSSKEPDYDMLHIMTTSERLIEAARKNDEATQFTILLQELKQRMIESALKYSNDIARDTAEDLVQDLIIKLVQNNSFSKLDPQKNIYSYLIRCTRNAVRDWSDAATTVHDREKTVSLAPLIETQSSGESSMDIDDSSDHIAFRGSAQIDSDNDAGESPSFLTSALERLIANPVHRSVIRIYFGYEPMPDEYAAIAKVTAVHPLAISRNVWEMRSERDQADQAHRERIAKLAYLCETRQRRLYQMEREFESLDHSSDVPDDVLDAQYREIERMTCLVRQAYHVYANAQKQKPKRISSKEIASVTGLSQSNVDQILSRLRQRLRQLDPENQ